ncbi:MAG: hypothetical protein GQ569_07110 [Methylococcaceae bacterium]|nr:hypothetical protein [Methylococcaceae bacterium]
MLEFENAIVLLSSNEPDKNKAFGSAFIIARDNDYSYLLTCAHVIEQINGLNAVENKLKILGLECPVEIACCGASNAIDIALLKVAGLFDKPVFKQFALGQSQNEIYVTGYSSFEKRHLKRPLKGKLGKSTKITANGKEAPFWDIHITDDDLSKLDSGYSGSPIYNQEGQVLAIVSHKRSSDIGHAFCISNLKILYPDINQLIPEIDKLNENPRIKNVRTGLVKRMAEIIKVYRTMGKCLLQMEKQGIDDDAEVILMTCEAFIANDIDTQDFIVFCQTLENDSSDKNSDTPNYSSLAQRLNNGEIALCIGSELAPSLDSKLKSVKELPSHISALANFEHVNDQALAEVCEYAELHTDCTRNTIIAELRKILTPPLDYTPQIALYELLTRLDKPFLVIACGFDTLLEQRLKNSGKSFVSIVSNSNSESSDQRLFLKYSDKENHFCSDEQLSSLRLMEEGYSLIYHPRGYPDEQQDTLLLSERDYFNASDLLNKRYPAYLHNKLKGRGLWFLGYHPDTWETRLLAKVLQYQRRNNRDQPLVIQQQANAFAKFFWREIQCQHYNDIRLSEFITNIETFL